MKRDDLAYQLYIQTLPNESRYNPYGKSVLQAVFEHTLKNYFKGLSFWKKLKILLFTHK